MVGTKDFTSWTKNCSPSKHQISLLSYFRLHWSASGVCWRPVLFKGELSAEQGRQLLECIADVMILEEIVSKVIFKWSHSRDMLWHLRGVSRPPHLQIRTGFGMSSPVAKKPKLVPTTAKISINPTGTPTLVTTTVQLPSQPLPPSAALGSPPASGAAGSTSGRICKKTTSIFNGPVFSMGLSIFRSFRSSAISSDEVPSKTKVLFHYERGL